PPSTTLFPYTTLFRSSLRASGDPCLNAWGGNRATPFSIQSASQANLCLTETMIYGISVRVNRPTSQGTLACQEKLFRVMEISTRSEEHTSELQSRGHL